MKTKVQKLRHARLEEIRRTVIDIYTEELLDPKNRDIIVAAYNDGLTRNITNKVRDGLDNRPLEELKKDAAWMSDFRHFCKTHGLTIETAYQKY